MIYQNELSDWDDLSEGYIIGNETPQKKESMCSVSENTQEHVFTFVIIFGSLDQENMAYLFGPNNKK